jgi:hypothetical protein
VRYTLAWTLHLRCHSGTIKKVTVQPIGEPALQTTTFLRPPTEYEIGKREVFWTTLNLHLFSRLANPKLWEGFDSQEVFWAGFEVTFYFADEHKPAVALVQWVMLWPRDNSQALDALHDFMTWRRTSPSTGRPTSWRAATAGPSTPAPGTARWSTGSTRPFESICFPPASSPIRPIWSSRFLPDSWRVCLAGLAWRTSRSGERTSQPYGKPR